MIKDEIVKRAFNYFSGPFSDGKFKYLSDKYLSKEQFFIELDDGEQITRNIWGLEGKIKDSIIRALIADISIDESEQEFVLIFQLDNLSVYYVKYNFTTNSGNAYFTHENISFIELNNLMLAKMLVGIEQLNEIIIEYLPLSKENYNILYKHLINLIKHEQECQ